jgi:hypothetical protein
MNRKTKHASRNTNESERRNVSMKTVLICLFLVAAAPFIVAQQPTATTQLSDASAPQKSISNYLGLHTLPAKNQTAQQQQQDEITCYAWAKQDSGFDPLAALTGQQQAAASAPAQPTTRQTQGAEAKGAVEGAAGGAATGAVIGAITGNAGKGAAAGAAGGGLLGLAMGRHAQQQAELQQQQQAQQQARAKAQIQQQLDGFKKGFSACMEAKNYVVK